MGHMTFKEASRNPVLPVYIILLQGKQDYIPKPQHCGRSLYLYQLKLVKQLHVTILYYDPSTRISNRES